MASTGCAAGVSCKSLASFSAVSAALAILKTFSKVRSVSASTYIVLQTMIFITTNKAIVKHVLWGFYKCAML